MVTLVNITVKKFGNIPARSELKLHGVDSPHAFPMPAYTGEMSAKNEAAAVAKVVDLIA
jgi:hypothetical protein